MKMPANDNDKACLALFGHVSPFKGFRRDVIDNSGPAVPTIFMLDGVRVVEWPQ